MKAELGDEAMDEEEFDPVPEITPQHFIAAMADARRSVSDADLAKYSAFAANMSQQRSNLQAAAGPGGFSFPGASAGAPAPAGATAAADEEDDDALYT